MATFKVLRQHHGDKAYLAGDMRKAEPADVAHLVKAGVLLPLAAAAEAPAKSKAQGGAPQNKAQSAPANKSA